MRLSTLERFHTIVIQMHDNPDADAVGSGYALYKYFEAKGKNVRLVYGGSFRIKKSNMVLLLKELQIPVEHVTDIGNPELLLTVDCQYGEGNVQRFEAQNIAMIDHHNTGRHSDRMSEIRGNLVSCSTVCYEMLREEGFDVNSDSSISTALYYGLYMDSNELSEIRHPLEWDMVDLLQIDKELLTRLTHANFTLQEMETAGIAMLRYNYDKNKRIAIIRSKPCDPNILGIIGNFVLQVDCIDVCVIFNECPNGYKLSVRSCVPDVAANDMAEFLTENIGNGGGHVDKAGGFINSAEYRKIYGELSIETYFFSRVELYYKSYDVVYARDGIRDISGFRLYRKVPFTCGYVRTTDLFQENTEFRIRTFEGDTFVTASQSSYLLIGYFGEVFPIGSDAFEKKYCPKEKPYHKTFEYPPSVRRLSDNKTCDLIPYAMQCICMDDTMVYARHLKNPTKVFTKWNNEKYMYGNSNDYICFSRDDDRDIYLVKQEVFDKTYEEVRP